jgi:hypothetical protein
MNTHYDVVLADLKRMKADAEASLATADAGIAAIERLISQNQTSASVTVKNAPAAENFHDYEDQNEDEGVEEASIPERILAFLAENQGQTFTTQEIAESIGSTQVQTVRGALSRLYGKKKIGKYGRGRYRARKPNEPESEQES